jgi:hypothetical protein
MVAVRLGMVLCEGAPADVVADPEVVRAYLGASEATINRSGALPAALAAAGIRTTQPKALVAAEVVGEGHDSHG